APGLAPRAAEGPQGAGRAYPNPPTDPEYVGWVGPGPTSLEIYNQCIVGDQLPLSGLTNSCYAIPSLSRQAAGPTEIDLVAARAEAHAPIPAKIQVFGGVLGVVWDTANPRQSLQSAENLLGPWTDVPGATTSPYLLVPEAPNKFL